MSAACDETTAKGRPCRRPAIEGTTKCALHTRVEPGARALLTDEVADRIVTLLRAGCYDRVAAEAAGIAPRTFREWLQRGRSLLERDAPYRRLLERVQKARAEGEATHVARITAAAQQGDWHASAWFLERSYPERWGKGTARVAVDETEAEASTEPKPLSPLEEVDELAAKRERRGS